MVIACSVRNKVDKMSPVGVRTVLILADSGFDLVHRSSLIRTYYIGQYIHKWRRPIQLRGWIPPGQNAARCQQLVEACGLRLDPALAVQ